MRFLSLFTRDRIPQHSNFSQQPPYSATDLEQQHQQPSQEKTGVASNQHTSAAHLSTASDIPFSSQSLPPPQLNYPPPPQALLEFQALVGISSPPYFQHLKSGSTPNSASSYKRPAANEGIYKRTVDEESRVHLLHQASAWMVNSFFLLQIIVGAALTALGAAKGPAAAVTILGAVNTIAAGLLTYLKGQGLPNRLESYLHQLRALREHIEEMERMFLKPDGPDGPGSVDEEVARIWKMYQEVRQTAQDNKPGVVLPPRGLITGLLKKPDIERKDVLAPMGDKDPGKVVRDGLHNLKEMQHKWAIPTGATAGEHGIRESLQTHGFDDVQQHVSGGLKDQANKVSNIMSGMVDIAEREFETGTSKANDTIRREQDVTIEAAKKEVEQTRSDVNRVLDQSVNEVKRRLDETGRGT